GAALKESRGPGRRCAAVRYSRNAALARPDVGIRGLGESDESAVSARALRKSCPMTMGSRGNTRFWRHLAFGNRFENPILRLRVDFRTGLCELRCLLFQSFRIASNTSRMRMG